VAGFAPGVPAAAASVEGGMVMAMPELPNSAAEQLQLNSVSSVSDDDESRQLAQLAAYEYVIFDDFIIHVLINLCVFCTVTLSLFIKLPLLRFLAKTQIILVQKIQVNSWKCFSTAGEYMCISSVVESIVPRK